MSITLVTGATGFIGCRLVELWRSDTRKIRAIGMVRNDIEKARAAALRTCGTDLVVDDLANSNDLDALLDGVDTVVHLAAAQHEANVGEDYFIKINVDTTRKLLECCERSGVQNFFYASSIGVYGVHDDGPVDLQTTFNPDNTYGRSKAAAEAMLQEYGGNVHVYIGRIGETYGPWDLRLHKLYAGIQKSRFWLVGPCQNLHQPIYVDDLASAIDAMLADSTCISKPLILCGQNAITTQEMCASIASALDVPLRRWRIPMWPLLVAAVTMEMTLGKAGIQPPLHRRRLDFFRKSLSFSTTHLDYLVDLPPQVSFTDGAQRTYKWYVENAWL